MRHARWLVLFLIAIILTGLSLVYVVQKSAQARTTPPSPAKLPTSVSARANDWTWEKTQDGRPLVRVWARDMNQTATGDQIELEHVELHLFHKDGKTFDRVRSAKADFNLPNGHLFSDGDVEITMAVPAQPDTKPQGRLVVIRTSGVHFESKTGKAFTDRPAAFSFDRGDGNSVGAQYDPLTRALHMRRNVTLTWRGDDPKAKPMDIEAGSLIYKETESKVFLLDGSKFRRDTLTMDGSAAVVFLKEGLIEAVEATVAKGTDVRPRQTVEYSADQLRILFDENGILRNVAGEGSAKLISTTATAKTNVAANRLDMEFLTANGESTLRKALATTEAIVRSEPLSRPDTPLGDTRILRSDLVALFMREGGEEMERVEAQAPGIAEFVPNRPGQKHRTVNGNGMTVEYGPANQAKTFTATDVKTQTDNDPLNGKPQPPALTWSQGMAAHFDPGSGALSLLEQWGNFRYEEGDRRAKAERAELRQPADEMKLLGGARVWDPAGSTTAATISMKQKTGDFDAVGDVSSTREPDKTKPASPKKEENTGGLLAGDEPLQARAANMTSSRDNTLITYTGNALLWQGSNRITADTIRIDRRINRLEASGNVHSQLLDRNQPSGSNASKRPKPPLFTNVTAPQMTYDDKARLARYSGGSTLVRGAMTVTAADIRAWLKQGDDSSLDHAFADTGVKIVEVSPERTRTGTSEHAEYYVTDGKVLLAGGQPAFADSVKGNTRGRQITYFSNDERLLVEGEEKKPVESRLKRKGK